MTDREEWQALPKPLAMCGLERIAYEQDKARRALVGTRELSTMKWLAMARIRATRAGFTLQDIDRAEAIALAESKDA